MLVRVRFEAAAVLYIVETFGDEARAVGEGRVEVKVPGDSVKWVTQWVLSFGGDAVVVEPEWARAAVAKAAAAWLAE
jgi:proteasome accessory factor C